MDEAARPNAGWHERAAATRRARSESSLLAAAVEVFQETGFEVATVESIANRAGVGAATVYRHFESKAALLSAALAFAVPARQAELAAPVKRGITAYLVRVAALLGRRLELAEALLPVLAARALRSRPGGTRIPDLADPIAAILAAARERGDVRPEIDPAELAPMILSLLLIRMLRRNESARVSAESVAEMILSGAAA